LFKPLPPPPSTLGERAGCGRGAGKGKSLWEVRKTTKMNRSLLKDLFCFADIFIWEGWIMEKKVWGIVLIVVGVLAVLGSFSNLHDVAASESLITGISKTVPGVQKYVTTAIRNEKVYSVAGVGLGIIFAVFGTMLLSKAPPSRHIVRIYDHSIDTDERDDDQPGKWKF
jgi:hypothetical protein